MIVKLLLLQFISFHRMLECRMCRVLTTTFVVSVVRRAICFHYFVKLFFFLYDFHAITSAVAHSILIGSHNQTNFFSTSETI